MYFFLVALFVCMSSPGKETKETHRRWKHIYPTRRKTTDSSIGNMIETAIYSQWMQRDWFTPWYARWDKGEVDMVGLDDKNFK